MDKEQIKLEEQEAPLKNTDRAFVKVSEDGSPVIPRDSEKENKDKDIHHNGRPTDLEKR